MQTFNIRLFFTSANIDYIINKYQLTDHSVKPRDNCNEFTALCVSELDRVSLKTAIERSICGFDNNSSISGFVPYFELFVFK